MKVEKPDSPVKPIKPARRGHGFSIRWKWLGHPAIIITLGIIFLFAYICLLVYSASESNHDASTFLDRFHELFH
jgi:hypothetical protein